MKQPWYLFLHIIYWLPQILFFSQKGSTVRRFRFILGVIKRNQISLLKFREKIYFYVSVLRRTVELLLQRLRPRWIASPAQASLKFPTNGPPCRLIPLTTSCLCLPTRIWRAHKPFHQREREREIMARNGGDLFLKVVKVDTCLSATFPFSTSLHTGSSSATMVLESWQW